MVSSKITQDHEVSSSSEGETIDTDDDNHVQVDQENLLTYADVDDLIHELITSGEDENCYVPAVMDELRSYYNYWLVGLRKIIDFYLVYVVTIPIKILYILF